MIEVEGVLERVDLGAGGFAVRRGDGGRVVLVGEVPAGLVGRAVRVRGREAEGFGFLMTGDPTVEVVAITAR
jgi:hypothetical protein